MRNIINSKKYLNKIIENNKEQKQEKTWEKIINSFQIEKNNY
jgi:hypothetical protein